MEVRIEKIETYKSNMVIWFDNGVRTELYSDNYICSCIPFTREELAYELVNYNNVPVSCVGEVIDALEEVEWVDLDTRSFTVGHTNFIVRVISRYTRYCCEVNGDVVAEYAFDVSEGDIDIATEKFKEQFTNKNVLKTV